MNRYNYIAPWSYIFNVHGVHGVQVVQGMNGVNMVNTNSTILNIYLLHPMKLTFRKI